VQAVLAHPAMLVLEERGSWWGALLISDGSRGSPLYRRGRGSASPPHSRSSCGPTWSLLRPIVSSFRPNLHHICPRSPHFLHNLVLYHIGGGKERRKPQSTATGGTVMRNVARGGRGAVNATASGSSGHARPRRARPTAGSTSDLWRLEGITTVPAVTHGLPGHRSVFRINRPRTQLSDIGML
jgi:hypothetical protein